MRKPVSFYWKLSVVAAGALALMALAPVAEADDSLDSLRVGTTVYTNVNVMTKTPTDIFFKHAHGFGNAKLKDIDRPVLAKLGYLLPPEEGETKSVFNRPAQTFMASAAVTNFVADERVQNAQKIVEEKMAEAWELATPEVLYGFVGGVISFYLFFCFCCRQICVKTGQRGSPLIWLPVLQLFPLLRAAAIPAWWALPALLTLPIGLPVLSIVWSFKIVKARGKNWAVGLLLLFPVINILAFLYLAFSGNGGPAPATGNVISLGGSSRRAAA